MHQQQGAVNVNFKLNVTFSVCELQKIGKRKNSTTRFVFHLTDTFLKVPFINFNEIRRLTILMHSLFFYQKHLVQCKKELSLF